MALGLDEAVTPDFDAGVVNVGFEADVFSASAPSVGTPFVGPIGEEGEASLEADGTDAARGGLPLEEAAVGVDGEERGVFGLKLFFGVVAANGVGVSGDVVSGEAPEMPVALVSFFTLGRGEGGLKPERAANLGAILDGVVGVEEDALGAVEVGVDLRGEAAAAAGVVVGVTGGDGVASIFGGLEPFSEDVDLGNDTVGLVGDAGKDFDADVLTVERAPFFVGREEGGASAREGGLIGGCFADADSGNFLSSVLGLSTLLAGETGGLAAAVDVPVVVLATPVGVFIDA